MDGDGNNLMNENNNHEEHTANASIWYLCAFLFYIPLLIWFVLLLLLQLNLISSKKKNRFPIMFLTLSTISLSARFVWCILRASEDATSYRSIFSSISDLSNLTALSCYLLSLCLIMDNVRNKEYPQTMLCTLFNITVYVIYVLFRLRYFSEKYAEIGYVITMSVARLLLGLYFIYVGRELQVRLGKFGVLRETGNRVCCLGVVVCIFYVLQVSLWTLGTISDNGKLLGKIDSILYPWFYYPLPDTFCNSFFLFFFTAAVNRQLQNSRKLGSPLRYSSYEQHEDDMETDENGFAKQTPLDFGYYNQINNADVASGV